MLTHRQAEIVELISQGLTAKVVGQQLGLQESTVIKHLQVARQRTGSVSTLSMAVRWVKGELAVEGTSRE